VFRLFLAGTGEEHLYTAASWLPPPAGGKHSSQRGIPGLRAAPAGFLKGLDTVKTSQHTDQHPSQAPGPSVVTTRDKIVRTALRYNGTCNGQGYDGANPFSADLSRPAEAWCGDFVTEIYKRAQIPLPSMQPRCRTGFAYCPDAVNYGRAHRVTRYSWEAEPEVVHFGGSAHLTKPGQPPPT
jgi:hypothetical protein